MMLLYWHSRTGRGAFWMRNDFVTLSHEPVGNSEQLLKIKAQLVKIKTQLLYFCKVFTKTG